MVTATEAHKDVVRAWFGHNVQDVRCFFAPGRVNLIGEHLDYNGGRVLPAALELGIWLFARVRSDGRFRFASMGFTDEVELEDGDLTYRPEHGYANYPKGVLSVLQQQGIRLSGLDCFFYSNLPQGAGLSSSAAMEVVTGFAVSTLAGRCLTPQTLARISQQAENTYIGVQCGIMDQFAVTAGARESAVLLDCERLTFDYVPLKLGRYRLVIMNSNKERRLSESRYNQRREECQAALEILRRLDPEVPSLASLTPQRWQAYRSSFQSETLRRRVDHVVSENARVIEAERLLRQGDLVGFGGLMNLSHQSLRDAFEVTGPELDALAEAAQEAPGSLGARMTGAGFGGCVVALVDAERIADFVDQVERQYRKTVGYAPSFYESGAGDGVREVTAEVVL